ncbi:hypothetical protein [Ferruginibacter sp. HRS2-29]|uniref:hypothetical protein n=1 Tax=Ferruginibacter sp. HRS2-29 TaxID=2487334 RepID=UPI0020CBC1AA|nr:hypothetical protein [Ferruginibacter sp. HRS2-29]
MARFFDFDYEKMISYFWRCRAGLGYAEVQYHGISKSGLEYFSHRKFITVPLGIRKYSSLSKKSEAYVELGTYNKYELTDKVDYSDPFYTDIKNTNGGYSLDIMVFAGFKTQLGKKSMVDLGFGGTKNLLAVYKLKQNKIRVSASYITLNLSRKLGK